MTEQTKIEWADFTVNFWEGCQKVGPGCDHCYAEARDVRFTGGSHWGPGAPRRKVAGGVAKMRKIQRDAPAFRAEHGRWPRVFCSSLSDVFDNAVDYDWRQEAFTEIEAATDTRPMLLTKRVGNVQKIVPKHWTLGRWPGHVGLMITVVNQDEADRDVPKLLDLKANLGIPWIGLSMEPLLGPVNLTDLRPAYHDGDPNALTGRQIYTAYNMPGARDTMEAHQRTTGKLDWVIAGGESGREARPSRPDWFRDLRDQCDRADVPFLFKQWGEWHADALAYTDTEGRCPPPKMKIGKKRAGRLLDGVTHDGFPEALT